MRSSQKYCAPTLELRLDQVGFSGSAGGRTGLTTVTTALSPATAHIPQVVVGPQHARHAIGLTLLQHAFAAARQAGFSAITLMVDEQNVPAQTLYAALGFVECSAFASGRRPGLVRSSYGSSAGRRIAV